MCDPDRSYGVFLKAYNMLLLGAAKKAWYKWSEGTASELAQQRAVCLEGTREEQCLVPFKKPPLIQSVLIQWVNEKLLGL